MRKPDLVFLAVILFIAAALRVWAPWGDVFPSTALGASGDRVNFLETDAWHHVRRLLGRAREALEVERPALP